MNLFLVKSSLGRIVLHLIATIYAGHFAFHWAGIIREIARR